MRKLADYTYPMNLWTLRVLITIAEGCPDHPSYRGIGKPPAKCATCREIRYARKDISNLPRR